MTTAQVREEQAQARWETMSDRRQLELYRDMVAAVRDLRHLLSQCRSRRAAWKKYALHCESHCLMSGMDLDGRPSHD